MQLSSFNYSRLRLDNFGDWPLYAQFMLGFVCLSLLFITGYYLLISQKLNTYRVLLKTKATLIQTQSTKKIQADEEHSFRTKAALAQQRFKDTIKVWSTRYTMPGMLDVLSKEAVSHGLKLKILTPKHEIQHDFYIEQPIGLTLCGTYQHIALFLNEIVHRYSMITVGDFQIVPAYTEDMQQPAQATLESGQYALEMQVLIKIYQIRGFHEE